MFKIPQEIYREMVDFSQREKPNEACGILGGAENTATVFYPMTNTEKSSVRYLMDPREQFDVIKNLRAIKKEMVAIFHSHPHSQAFPSNIDVEMAYYPVIYLILSLETEPVLRGFKIDRKSGHIEEIMIKI